MLNKEIFKSEINKLAEEITNTDLSKGWALLSMMEYSMDNKEETPDAILHQLRKNFGER